MHTVTVTRRSTRILAALAAAIAAAFAIGLTAQSAQSPPSSTHILADYDTSPG